MTEIDTSQGAVERLIERLSLYERAWGCEPSVAPHVEQHPGITTGRVITDARDAITALDALRTALTEALALSDRLRQEAEIHAQEARTMKAIVHEAYQVATGATGEPGNWNGAQPIRDALERVRKEARREGMEEAAQRADQLADFEVGKRAAVSLGARLATDAIRRDDV